MEVFETGMSFWRDPDWTFQFDHQTGIAALSAYAKASIDKQACKKCSAILYGSEVASDEKSSVGLLKTGQIFHPPPDLNSEVNNADP